MLTRLHSLSSVVGSVRDAKSLFFHLLFCFPEVRSSDLQWKLILCLVALMVFAIVLLVMVAEVANTNRT